jgi:hypothetical protein
MSSMASPGASFTSYAIPFELIYEARRYYFNFGTKSNNSFLNLYYTLHARFIVTEHFFVGIGSMFSFYFWYSDKSKETENQPGDVLSPSLSISYKSLRFEVDLMMTPYSRMELNDPTGEYDNNFFGFRGKLDLAYFFRLKTGIRASVEYANMKNIDTGSDYQTQELLASEGLVLRL